jgi:DNA-binding GntR family transcriptional regulator
MSAPGAGAGRSIDEAEKWVKDGQLQLRKPDRSRLVDDVRRSLEDAILSGEAAPGSRLVEDAIAKQLSVSRTTVREALLMLERRGLIVSRPRGGTFVTRISHSDALDIGFTRALLESFAVTLGTECISAAVISEMSALIDEMGECHLPNELPRLLRIDLAFHRKVVESAKMPRLLELWSNLDGQIGALYIRAIEQYNVDIDYVVAFHSAYLDAVRTGDPAIARPAVLHHYVSRNEPDQIRTLALEQSINTLTVEAGVLFSDGKG